jgi:predicted MFS family arabinose efflux permease
MSLSNASSSHSDAVGGSLHAALVPSLGWDRTYQVLIALGALTTALAWIVLPWLRRTAPAPAPDEAPAP